MIDRVVISGGGTGGHIFPAIAIADEIKNRNPKVKILFVGAAGKMEMEKVPQAGYKIEGLRIAGFQRKFAWSNFLLPFKIIKSLLKARRILTQFKPQLVIGVGGYASGPTLKMANLLGIPTLIQEQNSYPGKTNRMLARRAENICVAYDKMDQYFPKKKIILTGNPVRKEFHVKQDLRADAFNYYKLDPTKPVLLVIGGSLGAKTLNRSLARNIETINKAGIQVIWQTGSHYYSDLVEELFREEMKHIHLLQFINRMDLAYAAADVIISRAGAISVSELCMVGKPIVLVPSPNVSDDHQTKNALALVEKGAAILVKDGDAREKLVKKTLDLIKDTKRCQEISVALKQLEKPNATIEIVDVCEGIVARTAKPKSNHKSKTK
ncbi:MAG: undecaprenyldiphospho-muramoylpentapeptide beta-N-acetylglucosaminyltransferase [Flavobacteriales bacterium]|nr:undecaprenyldiphospho-muramoylpentapeptide beta-N-acetylglucosaminyltransferase [Flavobacteriales bacterium]